MAVLDLSRTGPRRPPGSPAYSSGWRRFRDRLLLHGLEYFGLFYSVYRGKVINRDDPDSEGQIDPQGRLRVQVAAVGDDENMSRLAYPIFSFAGNGFGLKNLPPVDAFVLVMFENGRLDTPMWFGGWYAQNQIPDELKEADSFGWVTPGGHKFLLDEQDGEEFVRLEHQDGAKVEIDKDGNISITNVSGKKVNVGDGAEDADEPAALGNTLKGLLEELIDAINAITVPTPAGASGTPVNAPQFSAIKGRFERFLSRTVQVK